MSTLYIEEYAQLAHDDNGMPVMAGSQPPLARQTVTVSGISAPSSALNAGTRYVRLHCDGIMSYRFDTGTPVALTTDPRQAASVTEFFGIDPAYVGQSLKVAAITNT